MTYRRKYLLIIRNSASARIHRSIFIDDVEDDGLRLIIHNAEILVSLNSSEDGEYQYAITPYYGEWETDEGKAYTDAITIEYAGNLLDSIIHCPDGDVTLRDLHPQTGILRIGDYDIPNAITNKDAGDGYYNNYYYDEDN